MAFYALDGSTSYSSILGAEPAGCLARVALQNVREADEQVRTIVCKPAP